MGDNDVEEKELQLRFPFAWRRSSSWPAAGATARAVAPMEEEEDGEEEEEEALLVTSPPARRTPQPSVPTHKAHLHF